MKPYESPARRFRHETLGEHPESDSPTVINDKGQEIFVAINRENKRRQ